MIKLLYWNFKMGIPPPLLTSVHILATSILDTELWFWFQKFKAAKFVSQTRDWQFVGVNIFCFCSDTHSHEVTILVLVIIMVCCHDVTLAVSFDVVLIEWFLGTRRVTTVSKSKFSWLSERHCCFIISQTDIKQNKKITPWRVLRRET